MKENGEKERLDLFAFGKRRRRRPTSSPSKGRHLCPRCARRVVGLNIGGEGEGKGKRECNPHETSESTERRARRADLTSRSRNYGLHATWRARANTSPVTSSMKTALPSYETVGWLAGWLAVSLSLSRTGAATARIAHTRRCHRRYCTV